MKRKCKNVDICSLSLITKAVLQCFSSPKKRKRYDTISWFAKVLSTNRAKARTILAEKNELFDLGCARIAREIQSMLQSPDLKLPKVATFQRVDPGSLKLRTIARLNIRQLALDHVAVVAMDELCRRIGPTQVSSIKGRGAHLGRKYIRRWTLTPRKSYFVKLDIKDFYGSVDRGALMRWLKKRIANRPLLQLINKLIFSSPKGLPIGSYLSQTIANIYLADIYHYAKEQCLSSRGIHQIKHALLYMDDILFVSNNARQLKRAVIAVVKFAKEQLGLIVKNNWTIRLLSDRYPIDMMGFRFYKGGRVTLRKRIFKYLRRSLLRVKSRFIELHQARRLMSYKGYSDYTATKTVLKALDAVQSFRKAISSISNHDILQSHVCS